MTEYTETSSMMGKMDKPAGSFSSIIGPVSQFIGIIISIGVLSAGAVIYVSKEIHGVELQVHSLKVSLNERIHQAEFNLLDRMYQSELKLLGEIKESEQKLQDSIKASEKMLMDRLDASEKMLMDRLDASEKMLVERLDSLENEVRNLSGQ